MRKTIPGREDLYCDVCGRLCGKGEAPRTRNGELIVKMDALDFQGKAVADASVRRELCDPCLERIGKVVNAEAEKIKDRFGGE